MIVELVKSPFWYLFKPRKIVWSDQGRRGLHKGGENCLKYLIRGWSKKEGRGKKDLKKVGGKAWSKGGCLMYIQMFIYEFRYGQALSLQ